MKNTTSTYLVALLLACTLGAPAAFADNHRSPMKSVYRAAVAGPEQLRKVLDSGVDINTGDEDAETALMKAADKGNLYAVKTLIAAGANVNQSDEDAETALMKAADEGHTEVVKALLSAGADINATDEDGETALRKALHERHRDTEAVLRAAGAR